MGGTYMEGLIHIYTGTGKGKTTAAVGLAVRFAGSGGKVLFAQFLKNDKSSELYALRQITNIEFLPSFNYFGFTHSMTPLIKEKAQKHYTDYFGKIINKTLSSNYGLLILDEIIAADNNGLVPHGKLTDFLKNKPAYLEIVLTGRSPSQDLLDTADYISDIHKVKHPFDKNIPARMGIEK